MFSGRPDPQWQILSSNPNYREIERLLGEARKRGFVYRPEDIPAKLGFRGFILEDTMTKPKKELIVGRNTVRLQELLLQTMPGGLVPNQVRQNTLTEIRSGKIMADVGGKRAKRWAPQYLPYWWNLDSSVTKNNCYNYATTLMTHTFAQPGRGSGRQYSWPITGSGVRDAAKRDGLIEVNIPPNVTPRAPSGRWQYWNIVALAVGGGRQKN